MSEASATARREGIGAPLASLSPAVAAGHFPMSENPPLFLSYLEPVLAEIAAGG